MGDDARDGHVEGHGDVHQGLAVLQDGRDELVAEVAVGAAVAAGLASSGVDVLDAGVLPTPATAFLIADIDADYFLLIDGDGTYDPEAAPVLIDELVSQGADMVVGCRRPEAGAHRRGHEAGNQMLSWTFRSLFGLHLRDTLSGYRAFSRRFVKTFPRWLVSFGVA